jgi:hypothetical protein
MNNFVERQSAYETEALLAENLLLHHFMQHKFRRSKPDIEPGPLQFAAGD